MKRYFALSALTVAVGFALVGHSESVTAGTCEFSNGAHMTCSGDINITGGTYDSASISRDDTGTTLTMSDATINGQGAMIDGSGYIFGGNGKNHLILHNNTASEVVGGGDGSTISIYGGHYDRVLGGRGDSTVNIYGNDVYIGALSGDFYNDPGGAADTAKNHDALNLFGVTDAIEKSPLAMAGVTSQQDNNFQGDAAGYGFEEVNLRDGTNLTLNNDLWNAGKADRPVLSIDNTSRLNISGQQTMYGSLSNSGTLNLDNGTASNQLHLTGNYTGNGGTLIMGSVLNDDMSAADRFVIDGDTAGTTGVIVNKAGGSGAKTLNGIELISVGGVSAGEFTQSGRIVAGAYDYKLERGLGDKAGNWYLVSGTLSEPTPAPEQTPEPTPEPIPAPEQTPEPTPVPIPTPEQTPEPAPAPAPERGPEWVRPDAGIYTANIAAANTLFVNRLHDRLGETHYVDALTGEERVTSLWLRNIGGHNRFKDSSGQLSTQANRYVMQLGGDIAQWSSEGQNRFHLGVMGGYANQKSNSRNSQTGYHADGSINGYSVGVYGTWLQDNDAKTGAYVDTWLQYSWFNNSVSGESTGSESYKSKGLTGAVEAGYTWKLGERDERTLFYIQPKAQVILMGVKADDHTEANGTRVSSEGDGNVQSRLGLRGFIKGHSKLDDGKQRTFEPFVEANWIHNTRSFGVTMDDVKVTQAGARNIGEVKVGVEGQINPHVNLWGNVAQQVGDKGYSDTSAMLGVKVSF